jgi:tetratricopeptide (TPR) repeat protein
VAVPPNADVTFEVTFISVLGHSDDGICEHALLRKAIGNSHFARGDYDKAINSYQKAMAKVDPSEHGNAGLKLLCDCGNNLALSCQKKGNLKGAVDATMAVLTLDPSNFKGLYRAAVVCTLLDRCV